MAQFAVLVGCCYPDDEFSLKGCHNDVESMQKLLTTRFGFDPQNVEVLTDKPDSPLQPTGANIKKKLYEMIEQAEPGDALLFYFSGHGTIDNAKGSASRIVEAIVPCDLNFLCSDDFRDMTRRVPEGADFIVISDCCHSGGLIGNLKEHVGPGLQPDHCYKPKSQTANSGSLVAKEIPITAILQRLQRLSGSNNPNIGDQMLNVFGTDASLKFQKRADGRKAFRVDRGILFSGCQFNESSYDDWDAPRPHGKFTTAIFNALKKQPGQISNRQLVEECRAILPKMLKDKQQQHPCLFCSHENADEVFLHES